MRNKFIIISSILLFFSITVEAQSKSTPIPIDKQFYIRAATIAGHDSSGFWDIQSKSSFFKKTITIQLWNLDESRFQKFVVKPSEEKEYYEICPINDETLCISVDTAAGVDFKAIKLMTRNNKSNQRFIIKHIGKGDFKIFDKFGRILGLTDCTVSNGSPVLSSKPNQNFCSDWFLIDVVSKKAFVPFDENTREIPFNSYIENKKIMKLIVGGRENEIKEYFRDVTPEEITKSDNGTIVKAFGKLNNNDKVTHTIWILEEVKNRQPEIRQYVYSELAKVDYSKPSVVLKHLINNYFTNFNESEADLKEKVNELQRKMNR